MRKFHLVYSFILFSGMASAQSKEQAALLDSVFTVLNGQHQFNGSVLIAEKGTIVLKKGYGYSNEITKSWNNTATVFELASCSKQFTAAAIVLLKRQEKLRYDDQLAKHIPELAFWNVTIEELLHHTSGLPDYIGDMSDAWDKTRIATNDDLIRFYAARKDSLQFVPGSVHDYNNTNYALLASIVERVSGQSYGTFLTKNIFKPLGMKNTFVYNRRQHDKKLKNYAIGYVWAKGSFDKVTQDDPRYGYEAVRFLDGIVGSAKVNSSVEDLYTWIRALRENKLFSKEEFEEMTRITQTTKGENIPYGFGLEISKGENKFSFGHTGSWDGYATFVYHDFLKDRTVITLQNFHAGTYPFMNITQTLNGQPLETEFRGKISVPEAEIRNYAGTYTNPNDPSDVQLITFLDGHLVHNTPNIPWDLRFFPVAQGEFQGVMQGGYDAVLKFVTLEDGSMQMQMMQYGEVVGTAVRQNR